MDRRTHNYTLMYDVYKQFSVNVVYDFQVLKIKLNLYTYRLLEGDTLDIQLNCNLFTKGKYRSTGRLFMFPIDGEGLSSIISSKYILLYKNHQLLNSSLELLFQCD